MTRRCIMIFPQFDNMEVIHGIRKEFDPLYKLVPPHITLAFPFDSEIPAQTLKNHLLQSVVRFKPFCLQMQGIQGGEGNYLFLKVTHGHDDLIELQKRIYHGILAQYMPHFLDLNQYIPHLTVGRIADQTEFTAALAKCHSIDDIFKDTIARLSVEIIDEFENSIIEMTIEMENITL